MRPSRSVPLGVGAGADDGGSLAGGVQRRRQHGLGDGLQGLAAPWEWVCRGIGCAVWDGTEAGVGGDIQRRGTVGRCGSG